jgi:hypothetical protein
MQDLSVNGRVGCHCSGDENPRLLVCYVRRVDGSAFIFDFKQFKKSSREEMTSLCNLCTVVSRCVFCVELLEVLTTRNCSDLNLQICLYGSSALPRGCVCLLSSLSYFQHLQNSL